MIQTLNKDNFEKTINSNQGSVIVDFFATWCGPCTRIAPILDEMAKNYKDSLTIFKVDIDESPDLAIKFKIMSVPTLIAFKDGKQIGVMTNIGNAESIKNKFEDLFKI